MLSDKQIKEMVEKEKEKELDSSVSPSQSINEPSVVEQSASEEPPHRDLSQHLPIQELVDTEKTYCHSLDVLANYFSSRGKTTESNKILAQLSDLIPQLQEISQKIYQHLTESIRTDLKPSELPRLREQRIQLIKLFFTIYPIYSEFYQKYLQEVLVNSEAFKEVESYLADPKNGAQQQDLASILIQIIQRGPRYEMLAGAILKHNKILPPKHPGKLTPEEIKRVEDLLALIKVSIDTVNSALPVLKLKQPSEESYQFGDWFLRDFFNYLTQGEEQSEVSPSASTSVVKEQKPYQFGDLFLRPTYRYLTGQEEEEKEAKQPEETPEPTISTSSTWGFARFWNVSKTPVASAPQANNASLTNDNNEDRPEEEDNFVLV